MPAQPFFQPPPQGGRRGERGGRRGHGSRGSTRGTKQQQPPQWHSIPSATFTKPWIRTDSAFRKSLTLHFPYKPSRGGEDSECVNPTGESKDSVCTVPTGGGKDSMCTAPIPERGKTPCVQSSPEGEKTLYRIYPNKFSSKSVYIQEKVKNLPVGVDWGSSFQSGKNEAPTSWL